MNSVSPNLNIVVVQMSSSSDETENLGQATSFLIKAAKQQADLVLLPENVLCHGSHDQIRKIAKTETDWINTLQKYSMDNALTVVWGGIPVKEKGQLFNKSLVIDHTGSLIAAYAKNHIFMFKDKISEKDLYTGGTTKSEFKIKDWRIALSICFDIRYPQFFQEYNSPDLIVCTAAFTQQTGKAHWEVLCRARAIENQCFLAAANQYTTSITPFKTFGHSLIVTPWGKITAIKQTESGIIRYTLVKDAINEVRKELPLG